MFKPVDDALPVIDSWKQEYAKEISACAAFLGEAAKDYDLAALGRMLGIYGCYTTKQAIATDADSILRYLLIRPSGVPRDKLWYETLETAIVYFSEGEVERVEFQAYVDELVTIGGFRDVAAMAEADMATGFWPCEDYRFQPVDESTSAQFAELLVWNFLDDPIDDRDETIALIHDIQEAVFEEQPRLQFFFPFDLERLIGQVVKPVGSDGLGLLPAFIEGGEQGTGLDAMTAVIEGCRFVEPDRKVFKTVEEVVIERPTKRYLSEKKKRLKVSHNEDEEHITLEDAGDIFLIGDMPWCYETAIKTINIETEVMNSCLERGLSDDYAYTFNFMSAYGFLLGFSDVVQDAAGIVIRMKQENLALFNERVEAGKLGKRDLGMARDFLSKTYWQLGDQYFLLGDYERAAAVYDDVLLDGVEKRSAGYFLASQLLDGGLRPDVLAQIAPFTVGKYLGRPITEDWDVRVFYEWALRELGYETNWNDFDAYVAGLDNPVLESSLVERGDYLSAYYMPTTSPWIPRK